MSKRGRWEIVSGEGLNGIGDATRDIVKRE